MKIQLNQIFRFVHRSDLAPEERTDEYGNVNLNFVLSNEGALPPGNVGRPMFWHKDTEVCCPAMYFHSNPFKKDRVVKPWIDVLLPDEGLVYYNGDNKTPGLGAGGGHNSGNRVMERLWEHYDAHDPMVRSKATPIFVFEHASAHETTKGYRKFIGYGILTRVDVRQEYDATSDGVFSNYLFEVSLLKVPPDGLDWQWIYDRRDPSLSIDQVNRNAPNAWKQFITGGLGEIYKIRQRIRHYEVSKPKQQCAELSSGHKKILNKIVAHYPESKAKGRFESLASLITQEFFGEHYRKGWITQHSGDMGIDFVGRLDLKNHFAPSPAGTVLGCTRMLVLGQAKCRTNYLDKEESARDIARVAARLQRGNVGVYITTGTYKESTQREVAIDGYPIVLINGRQLADLFSQYLNRTGMSVKVALDECDDWYKHNQKNMPPELILRDFD